MSKAKKILWGGFWENWTGLDPVRDEILEVGGNCDGLEF